MSDLIYKIAGKGQAEISDSWVRSVIDHAAVDAIFICDLNGNILYSNDSACQSHGYSQKELTSMNVLDLNPTVSRKELLQINKEARNAGSQIQQGFHKRKDGTRFPVEISFRIVTVKDQQVSCSIVRDITERLKAERELEQLRFALQNAADAVYLTDVEGKIHYANDSACSLLGYTHDELVGKNIFDIDADITTATESEEHRRLMQQKEGIFETRHRRKDGTIIPVEITFSNAKFNDVLYSFSFARDITDRKEAEKRNAELNFAIDNAVDAVYLFDESGRLFYTNRTARTMLGYSYEELAGMNVLDLTPEYPRENWPNHLKLIREEGLAPFEVNHLRKDGSLLPVEITVNSKWLDNTEYFCAFVRDITRRKEAEAENKKLRAAIDNAMDAVYILDKEGNIQYANQSASRELGYSLEELQNMRIADIDPNVSSVEGESLRQQRWGESLRGEQIIFESTHRRKDGGEFPVECSHSGIKISDDDEIVITFVRNIKERKQELRQQEELRVAIENSIDAVYLTDKDGDIYYVNNSACNMLGYSKEELTSMSVFEIDPAISQDRLDYLWQLDIEERLVTFEAVHLSKDGTEIPVEVNVQITEFEGSEYTCAIARDIRERKEAMRHIEEFRFAIENANDPVYLYDRQANIIYGNRIACETLGYTKEELTRLTVMDLDPTVTSEVWEDIYPRVEAGELKTMETINRTKDGTEFPVEVTAANVTYGDFQFGCAFNHDITERREQERHQLFLQFAIDSAGDAIFITTQDGSILYANQSACNSLGYTVNELMQLNVSDINPEIDQISEHSDFWNTDVGSETYIVESVHLRKDGTTFPVEIQSQLINFDNKKFSCAVARDITERRKAQEALLESEERFRVIAETSPVALLISRAGDGAILYANKQAATLFDKQLSDIIGNDISQLFNTSRDQQEILDIIKSRSQVFGREIMIKKQDESELCLSLSAHSISLQGEDVICSALLDITEAHKLAEQLSYQASYDSLTNLVNRREFQSHLQRVLVTARQTRTENALCFLDLDQFKIVNDTCGHIAGDELLRQLGQLLQNSIRKRDILARLGGDEFAILLENCNLQQAEKVAQNIRQVVQDFRFPWEDHTFNIGVSIGLVLIDWTSETTTDVLRRADTACYTAKDMGRNRIHVYHADDEELTKRHGEMQWVSRVNEALQENSLQLWHQKIVPLATEEDTGEYFEVLLRMNDKDGNVISPGSFLPTAERYSIAPRIDRWVITTIFKWYIRNPELMDNLALCSINISGQSLSDEELLEYILDYFANTKLQADKFCFEVTETAAIANLAHATRFIKALKEYGCRFALDDFGSGLSSFAYLKNLPVNFLKIDGQFVQDILDDPIDLAMVKSINEIGQVMGKFTIAEFVENDAVLEKLREVGVDYAQGYGIAKPSPLITSSAIHKLYQ